MVGNVVQRGLEISSTQISLKNLSLDPNCPELDYCPLRDWQVETCTLLERRNTTAQLTGQAVKDST